MIEIITQPITSEQLRAHLGQPFDEMVKFVVDIDKGIIALGGEMHADAEEVLLEHGSEQANLWGANVYPDRPVVNQLEYESLINIRPGQGNRSMFIEGDEIRRKVEAVSRRLLIKQTPSGSSVTPND